MVHCETMEYVVKFPLNHISRKQKSKTKNPKEFKQTKNNSRHHCAVITVIWTAADLEKKFTERPCCWLTKTTRLFVHELTMKIMTNPWNGLWKTFHTCQVPTHINHSRYTCMLVLMKVSINLWPKLTKLIETSGYSMYYYTYMYNRCHCLSMGCV